MSNRDIDSNHELHNLSISGQFNTVQSTQEYVAKKFLFRTYGPSDEDRMKQGAARDMCVKSIRTTSMCADGYDEAKLWLADNIKPAESSLAVRCARDGGEKGRGADIGATATYGHLQSRPKWYWVVGCRRRDNASQKGNKRLRA